MNVLSAKTLHDVRTGVQTPAYDRKKTGVGIVHLGAGAFFKAHLAVYTDTALELAGGDWGVCAVSINSTATKTNLVPQDGLYTLKIMDEPARYRVIGSIKDVLAGPDDRAAVILRIADPTIKIVTLTITEKGYCLGASGELDVSHLGIAKDLTGKFAPVTAIGILVAGLEERFAENQAPLTIISCDNISGNGTKLRGALLAFAKHVSPDLAKWIGANTAFPNTMVDSITPAGDEALCLDVERAIGLTDKAPVHREEFTDWVIEEFDGPRPAWEMAGAVFAPMLRLMSKQNCALSTHLIQH